MDTNPYAAPTARVADPEPNPYGLKRRGLVMMIVFMILTLGVYYPVWWFRRRAAVQPKTLIVLMQSTFIFRDD